MYARHAVHTEAFVRRAWRGWRGFRRRNRVLVWALKGAFFLLAIQLIFSFAWPSIRGASQDPSNLTAFVVGTIGAGIGVSGALLSRQIHLWQRRHATTEIALRWLDTEWLASLRRIGDAFPEWEGKREAIPLAVVTARLGADEGLRTDLHRVLNHLNIVAMGVEEGTYEIGQVHHLYGYLLPLYATQYREYLSERRHKVGRFHFGPEAHAIPDDPRVAVADHLLRVGDEWSAYAAAYAPRRKPAQEVPGADTPAD